MMSRHTTPKCVVGVAVMTKKAIAKECWWDIQPNCLVYYIEWIKDGFCHDWPPYNAKVCGWDGGKEFGIYRFGLNFVWFRIN